MYVYKQPVIGKPEHFRIQICVSERVNNKVKRRVIRHFGIAKNPYEIESIMRFAQSEIDREKALRENYTPLFDSKESLFSAPLPIKNSNKRIKKEEVFPNLNEVKEDSRYVEGFKNIYGDLYNEIFSTILPHNEDGILKELVLARIAKPESKRKTCETLEREMGFSTSLNSIYRMMDVLEKNIEKIQRNIFNKTRSLFDDKIEMMFFDVSTLYFESFDEDELRKFGYSKDQKFHMTQVVLALATTSEGLPLGYKLFPGNTAETKTLIKCIDEWSQILKIERVFLVADSAMCNFPNLYALQEKGIEFVVAARLKQLKIETKNKILNSNDYIPCQIELGEGLTWCKEIPYEMSQNKQSILGRLICTYSSSRASKDASDRERIIEKLKIKIGKKKAPSDNKINEKFSAKKLISNSGYIKYTKVENEKIASINEEKVKNDAEWDGLHGLFTNSSKPVSSIMSIYRRLFIIEESFRINKNDLSMRPIYHYKSSRIQAHIAICFIAFSLIRYLQFKLEKAGFKYSAERIRIELSHVQYSLFKDKKGKVYKMPSQTPPIAQTIYDCLGIERKTTVSRI